MQTTRTVGMKIRRQKSGSVRGGLDHVGEKVVLIAVKASKEISRNALIWALSHVVQPGDCAKLLVVIPPHTPSHKLWNFSKFNSDCTTGQWKSLSGNVRRDQKEDITETCSQMMLQLHNIYESDKAKFYLTNFLMVFGQIKMKIKVISGTTCGVVAAEAKKTRTQWVVLDRKLKKEAKACIEELECNVVVMKKSQPKILRLNLVGSPTKEVDQRLSSCLETTTDSFEGDESLWNTTKVPNVTPVSSPEHSSFSTTEPGTSSLSSSDLGFSPFLVADHDWDVKKDGFLDDSDSDSDPENLSSSPSTSLCSSGEFSKTERSPITDALRLKFSELDHRLEKPTMKSAREMTRCGGTCRRNRRRSALSVGTRRQFLERLRNGSRFASSKRPRTGGFGSVHRGVLKDGRMVAVKQHKIASSQGDNEFFSEVEVLSCAQHRNVVMLIGFCVEDGRRLLVYEYICNGSLDSHLYGHDHGPLEWSARQKIAVGAARGLRYLHEECRVGCIVHRDMRPNNILLTHDFEALVGDFGLARWQPDGETGVETRIIGTFGYLAPEYAQSGEITEKADVYSFGVVLVELITGRKAVDINRPKGQQYLTEWARPLLEETDITELIDPRLKNSYSDPEVRCMSHCASLCIRRDPHSRPRMSQSLILK
ncbi:hypothetical protein OSB04_031382 [Centaurea solstitialis]|uniref:Protein kinase domain-containing protein n=1 Tax=Centaurea solstitialis TaxID=347529 RepID=A0AA38S8U9_9ASTR|nr:hypothetical protein OSB04_031382 [Centaurea solstitialis]